MPAIAAARSPLLVSSIDYTIFLASGKGAQEPAEFSNLVQVCFEHIVA